MEEKMYITKSRGRFNLASNEYQYQIVLRGLPKDAPKQILSETFNEDEEPDISDIPPSEVVEIISERLESYLYSTSRDEKRKVIKWCRENSELIDSIWAKDEIERKKASIKRIEDKIKDLETYLL